MKRSPIKRTAPLRATGPARLTVKIRKCAAKECRRPFAPATPWQVICSDSLTCACAFAEQEATKREAKKAKREAAEDKEKRDALKTRKDWIKPTQDAVNRYVRFRDAGKGCISCGTCLVLGGVGGGFDAGHYRSRGSAPHLRFELTNVHGQCKRCNNQLAGNAVEFRRGLLERFGLQYVEALEADQEPRRHTVEEMAEIRKLVKQLEKEIQ